MTIYILHLYYDLMNLYGEIGNIKCLVKTLTEQKVKVVVDNLSINNDIDINKYDFIYIGSSTKENELFVLNDILKYEDELREYINNNKFILCTGNSFELFGKTLFNEKGISIFDYDTIDCDNIVGDVIEKSNIIKPNILGFSNRRSTINNNNYPMFEDKSLGVNYKNFYGTYVLGPILVRNPEFNKYIVTKLIKSKNNKFKFKKFDLSLDKKAYDSYLKTYHNN